MADHRHPDGRLDREQLSRRALLGRVGRGAAAGVAAWIVPEIVVASPAGAQPLSAPPTAGVGAYPPGTQPGEGGFPTGPDASTSPTSSGGAEDASATAASGTAASDTGGGALAFTGSEAEKLLGAGATLVAGGWVIHRWASRQEPSPESVPDEG